MKVALMVARWLKEQGIRHVFTVSGGADLHLIHAIDEIEGIDFICPQTEQAAGFAADAYARLTGLGCALATSGPGFTNLVTPIAASYYDSIPVLYIVGNVTRNRMRGSLGVRQLGFQETPAAEMVKPITNWADIIMFPENIITGLNACLKAMREGRPGPGLVDIPDDIQRCDLS